MATFSSLLFLGLLPAASAATQGCSAFMPCLGGLAPPFLANETYIPPACFAAIVQDLPPSNEITDCDPTSWTASTAPLDIGNDCLGQVAAYIIGYCLDAPLTLKAATLTTIFPNLDIATLTDSQLLQITAEIRTAVATGLNACCGFPIDKAWSLGVVYSVGSVVATTSLPLSIDAAQAAAANTAIGTISGSTAGTASGPSAVTNPKVSVQENSGKCGSDVDNVDKCQAHCIDQDPLIASVEYLTSPVLWLVRFQQCECSGLEKTWTSCGGVDTLDASDFTVLIVILAAFLLCCCICCCKCCGCFCFGKKSNKDGNSDGDKGQGSGFGF